MHTNIFSLIKLFLAPCIKYPHCLKYYCSTFEILLIHFVFALVGIYITKVQVIIFLISIPNNFIHDMNLLFLEYLLENHFGLPVECSCEVCEETIDNTPVFQRIRLQQIRSAIEHQPSQHGNMDATIPSDISIPLHYDVHHVLPKTTNKQTKSPCCLFALYSSFLAHGKVVYISYTLGKHVTVIYILRIFKEIFKEVCCLLIESQKSCLLTTSLLRVLKLLSSDSL